MKIALLDMDDTKFPNIALGKLARFFRTNSCRVTLNPKNPQIYDEILASRVFSYSPPIPPFATTNDTLPEEIEHLKPDLSDYNIQHIAYGFTSRGCIRKCPFCKVWKTEGYIRDHAHPEEFTDKSDHTVILLDNNILAASNFIETALWLIKHKKTVDFNQGLDARLINDENAHLLSKLTLKALRIAFDNSKLEQDVIKAVKNLRKHKVKPSRYECYVLHTGNDEDTLYRIRILEMLYVDPFVMPYVAEDGKKTPSKVARCIIAQ